MLLIALGLSVMAMLSQHAAIAQEQPADAQPQLDVAFLNPHWEVGHISRYEFDTSITTTTSMQLGPRQQEQQTGMQSNGQVIWQVDRVNADGSSVCTMKLEWIELTVIAPDGSVRKNDSRRGQGEIPMLHQLLKALTSNPVTVEVNADGSIAKVSGTDAMRRAMDPAELVPEDREFIRSATETAVLSGGPEQVVLGEVWSQVFEWPAELGSMRHDRTYTLANMEMIEGIPVATVNAKSDMSFQLDRKKLPEGGPPMQVRLLDGSSTSQIYFDMQRSETVGRFDQQSMKMQFTITIPNGQKLIRTVDRNTVSTTLRVSEE